MADNPNNGKQSSKKNSKENMNYIENEEKLHYRITEKRNYFITVT